MICWIFVMMCILMLWFWFLCVDVRYCLFLMVVRIMVLEEIVFLMLFILSVKLSWVESLLISVFFVLCCNKSSLYWIYNCVIVCWIDCFFCMICFVWKDILCVVIMIEVFFLIWSVGMMVLVKINFLLIKMLVVRCNV